MREAIFQSAKILIVDDEPDNVNLIRHILEIEGYTNLQSTRDGREVARLYAAFQPDLILLDLMMPFLDGFGVMEQLKPLLPEGAYLPILVLTGDGSSQTKNRALASGAADFLTKPFAADEMQLRVHNLLATRFLHLQLQKKNLLLEERVQERTAELTATNTALQTEIAERQQAEQGLQVAKDQLQVVLDTIPGGVSWIGSDLKYQGVNRYLAETFRVPAEAFIGQPVGFMNVSSDYAELVRDFMTSPEQQTSFEFTVTVADAEHTILMTACKHESEQAVFIGIDISRRKAVEAALQQAHDELEARVARRTDALAQANARLHDEIAEREQAEAALRHSERQFRTLVENAPDIISRFDRQLRHIFVSPAIERVVGIPPQAFIGKTNREMNMPRGLATKWEAMMRQVFETGQPNTAEFSFSGADGKTFYFESRAVAEIGENGAVESVLSLARDITERKQFEEQIRFQAHLLDTIGEAVITTDLQGTVIYWNRFAEVLYGWPAGEALGRNVATLTVPQMMQQQADEIMACLTAGEGWSGEFDVQRRDGTKFPALVRNQPVYDDGGTMVGIIGISTDITERRQAEQALRDQKAILQTIFDHISLMIAFYDRDGKFQLANREWERVLGWSLEEVSNHPDIMAEFYPAPEERQRVMNYMQQTTGEWVDFKITVRDGSIRDTSWKNIRLPDGTRIGIGQDITERRQTEAALRESEGRSRLLVEGAKDYAMFLMDIDGNIIDWNAGAERIIGYDKSEVLGHSADIIFTPEDRAAGVPQHEMRQATQNGRADNKRWHLRKDGTRFWADGVMTALYHDDGQLRGFAQVLRDGTVENQAAEALKDAEAEVRRQVAMLRLILDSAGEGIVVADEEGQLLIFNPMAERITGMGPTSVPASDWPAVYGLFLPDGVTHARPDQTPIARAIRGEAVEESEWFLRNPLLPDGIALSATARPLQDESGALRGGVVVFRDITERKRTEEALQQAREEAERANLAKSEFLSRMSHELRTPLNAILGFGQLLEMDELNAEQRQGVEQILKAGRHLLELINEVLDIARIESEQPLLEIEAVEVADIMSGVLDLVQPLATTRQIELHADWGETAGLYVQADRRRLNQALLNLLSNAVKYNREGGTATLSCETTADGQLCIAIADTGSGIPPDKMEHLFTPFARLGAERTEVEGTGLGLALSKRLVEVMGGTISVRSTLGEGSTFVVELPLTQSPVQIVSPTEYETASPRSLAREGETQLVVLYIEDNLSNFGLVQNILRHRPEIKLLAAMQGLVGIELAVEHGPDLILLDINLPDINGDEVLRRLREDASTRAIPVIVVSADATPPQIQRLLAAGAESYLTKPLDVKQFLKVMDAKLSDAKTKGNLS